MTTDFVVKKTGVQASTPPAVPALAKAPTGIAGLDEITGGGLPRGRTTLVTGSAGSGKTLLGIQFLVAGARDYGEPGVLLTFEESAAKVTANVASLGFDLGALRQDGRIAVQSFRVDPSEFIEAGDFDLDPLFLVLDDAIGRIGARRVVLDTIEVLLDAFANKTTVRAELSRLFRWLEERDVTAIATAEQGARTVTRQGIEEYVSDCVIVLDHRVNERVSTRRLRVLKYRGSAHGTNEYPFLISPTGFVVQPATSMRLTYPALEERISTGVPRLDHMLGGGVFRGSTVLVSGASGTGKTTVGAHLLDAACARGEQALWVLLKESPDQVLRNMRSIGRHLRPWADGGLLHFLASEPAAYGPETHLVSLAQLLGEIEPAVVVIDGLAALGPGPEGYDLAATISRQVDLLKSRGVTALFTTLAREDETSTVGISSLVDTWLVLRNVEHDGERNRLLSILKSRGGAHSNQVREFVLTDRGIELVDVYVGSGTVFVGAARIAQEARERDERARAAAQLQLRHNELQRAIIEDEAQLAVVAKRIEAAREEIDLIAGEAERAAANEEAARAAMAAQRWADMNGATAEGGVDG